MIWRPSWANLVPAKTANICPCFIQKIVKKWITWATLYVPHGLWSRMLLTRRIARFCFIKLSFWLSLFQTKQKNKRTPLTREKKYKKKKERKVGSCLTLLPNLLNKMLSVAKSSGSGISWAQRGGSVTASNALTTVAGPPSGFLLFENSKATWWNNALGAF